VIAGGAFVPARLSAFAVYNFRAAAAHPTDTMTSRQVQETTMIF